MSAPTEISVLLRLYTNKQNAPTVSIQEFSDYLQKYSRHYLQESPLLAAYLEDTQTVVLKELDRLEAEGKVSLSADAKGRRFAFVSQFFIDRIVQRYREIDEHPEISFPISTDVPQGFPQQCVKLIHITSDFSELIESAERSNSFLYQLAFPDETTPMIYPASISPEKLLDLSLSKIRLFLRKDESKDYIQKRLMIANPGKELVIKDHIAQFLTRPTESLSSMKHSGESYVFWSYLCSFIRQDYVKKNEKTVEEIALLQSVFITEYLNNHFKNRSQQGLQRETALKNLELCFQKSPYYFDMDAIARFTDSRGVPLLGQYRNDDLEQFIKEKSGDEGATSLPTLLVFKTDDGKRYFVLKEKVVPLVVRLCNESRKAIKDQLTHEWFKALSDFTQDEAMKTPQAFERKVESLCRVSAPILHALLSASFIPLFSLEAPIDGDKDSPNGFKMFDHGRLLSYHELLMLDRQGLLTDTRILLPFWYTLPIISSIMAFFRRPREKKPRPEAKRPAPQGAEGKAGALEAYGAGDDSRDFAKERKEELRNAVLAIERKILPEGSTLEGELSAYLDRWNRNLDLGIKKNLTEDVNSLIRDYIRRTIRTIKAASFTRERVAGLAETLVETPSLAKIKSREALQRYVELYILQLIKKIK